MAAGVRWGSLVAALLAPLEFLCGLKLERPAELPKIEPSSKESGPFQTRIRSPFPGSNDAFTIPMGVPVNSGTHNPKEG
jgi:hypothetical protein